MFTKSFRLFSIFGFRISIDASWFVLAALIVWSLATGFFPDPDVLPDRSATAYYLISAIAAAGMFASIVYHELAHSLVARHYRIKIAGITLFIFGGVAELEDEPPTAKSEFLVAIAGPIASLSLAGSLWLLLQILPEATPSYALIDYLAFMNTVLAVFNLIPAFPLDGGRVLRAALWWIQGSLSKATRIASLLGAALGIALMAYGAYNSYTSSSIGGMWQILIGFFIFNAAGSARRQTEVIEALQGVSVGQLMKAPPPSIPADITVERVTEHPDLSGRDISLPVTDNGQLIGIVEISALEKIPPEKRGEVAIRAITTALTADETLSPDASAIAALRQLSRARGNQALVVRNGQLAGWIHGRDIFDYINSHKQGGGSEIRQTAL
ncbi:MAG: site-2 protease family protein [Rhodomicrobiaceae bacterium]